MMMRRKNMLFLPALVTLGLWSTSCQSPPRPPSEMTLPAPYIAVYHGSVVRVNIEEQYVILECAALPKAGQEFTIRRSNRKSGVVRVTGQSSGRLIAADIIEGRPMVGDWFRDEASDIPRERSDL